MLSGESEAADDVEGETATEGSAEVPLAPLVFPLEDFPLKQSRDETLQPGGEYRWLPATPIRSTLLDRLYRVSRDKQTGEINTELLVPKSRRERVFQAAHYNHMSGHLGYDKTLHRIMARFH